MRSTENERNRRGRPVTAFDDDPLFDHTSDHVLWTRVNSAEAVPGVLTPAGWSLYGRQLECAARQGYADVGMIPRSLAHYPQAIDDRMVGIFAGRISVNVEIMRSLMAGLPGVTGDDVERDLLGSVRPGVQDRDYGWRLPAVLLKLPLRLALAGRAPARRRAQTGAWWSERLDAGGVRPGADPRQVLVEALDHFAAAVRLQATTRLIYQAASSTVAQLAQRAGVPDLSGQLMAGAGQIEETAVSDDLWALAHGHLDLRTFQARHGYHGPATGEVSSRSWRENPAPVQRLLPQLRDSPHPARRRERVVAERADAVSAVLAGLPARSRPAARIGLRMSPRAAIGLERTKAAFLMATDGARAAVRTIGQELSSADHIENADDAFQLFVEEILEPPGPDLRDRITRRLAARKRYLKIGIPETWQGMPTIEDTPEDSTSHPVGHLRGLGVGGGVVEGTVRIVLESDDPHDFTTNDILVCPTTDPSWVALMTLAAGLVIDIGGPASHGAIVAREIGIPCVIGTHSGTRDLRDGDQVRVDGTAGTVDVIQAAPR